MDRDERLATNETIFREVNERIRELEVTYDLGEPLQLVCECADTSCSEPMSIDPARYEQVRGCGRGFFVLPGHEIADLEDVVDRRPEYLVVVKRDRAGEVAEAADARG